MNLTLFSYFFFLHRRYAVLVAEAITDQETADIRHYLQQGRAWGSQRFQSHIEGLHGRDTSARSPV